jgi:predicted nucleic acid-binding protein
VSCLLPARNKPVHRWVLVTHNTTEFGRVTGLTLDDWQI